MSKIARSPEPLHQTVGRPRGGDPRPVRWDLKITEPVAPPAKISDGPPVDLTGASAEAAVVWGGISRPLQVEFRSRVEGKVTVSGDPSLSAGMPAGRLAELQLTITDSQGAMIDYVWPVVGETP